MGKNGFNWFVGVVEDRKDPKTLGRLRVRCLGYHTEDLIKLKTEDLPWAHVMNPITSATVSGLGQSPLGAVEGTWVVGFFQDGEDAQQPIIIGTLPGVPSDLPSKGNNKGFQDEVNANYPKYKDETDVNRLAVNDTDLPHSSLTMRKNDLDKKVGVAQIDGVFEGIAQTTSDLDAGGSVRTAKDAARDSYSSATIVGGEWSEPATPYAAEYPYNHVYESEAGHIRELDDTPGAERIHERHASGSGYEIGPDGTKVTRVKNDNYTIVTSNDFTHIKGTQRHTTDEGVRIRVNADGVKGNNYNIEVGAGSNVNIEVNEGNINLTTISPDVGDININASRDLNMEVGRNFNISVLNEVNVDVKGQWTESTRDKTESTGEHLLDAKNQTVTASNLIVLDGSFIDADAGTIELTGSSVVDIDGGVINLN